MKKMTFFALAAVMLSAVVLTSCKNEEEPAKNASNVTTDLALAMPSQVSNGMRHMPGTTAQLGGASDFDVNGMKGITLVPFAPKATVTTASQRHGENISLGTFADASVHTNAKGRTALFEGKQVPSGTSAFLFYGESAITGSNQFSTGVLNSSLAGQPSAFSFWLQPILGDVTTLTGDAAYTGLIAYLNSLANVRDSVGGKLWKDYTSTDNEGFADLFQAYSTLKVLSSAGIQRMMTDLYKSLTLIAATDSLAKNLKAAILNPTYASLNAAGDTVKLASSLQNFPEKFFIPTGSVAVSYNGSTQVFEGNAVAASYGSNFVSPAQLDHYVYPASLWYFANSEIKTSESSQKSWYTDGAEWTTILSKYNKSSVNTKTRSVAIVDTVQYAVARLDVRVKIVAGSYLEDRNIINDGVVNHISNPASGYPVSAILVGGQKSVGFDFTPETFGGTSASYVIYDTIMTNKPMKAETSDYGATNTTLVLETGANVDQYIAVEFTNTAKDFYGADGLVPLNGKFYMVGKLAAEDATETGNKVFKQDYTTTVKLSIANLKNAYNTIPDLKSPELEIGLLVDVNWKAGHSYEISFE